MLAISLSAIGLLAAGQLLYIAGSSNSLARSKSAACVAAQITIESLCALYRQDLSAADLTPGKHGPRNIDVPNPITGNVLNRFSVSWVVGKIADPRPGRSLHARTLRAEVTPVTIDGNANNRQGFNKTLNVMTVMSQELQ